MSGTERLNAVLAAVAVDRKKQLFFEPFFQPFCRLNFL
jgi:hypothetical protein